MDFIILSTEHQKVLFNENVKSLAYTKSLEAHFEKITTIMVRDNAIIQALADGYTQAQVAHHLEISRARVSQVVKKYKNSEYLTPDPYEGCCE